MRRENYKVDLICEEFIQKGERTQIIHKPEKIFRVREKKGNQHSGRD